jgi:hypothetical protein
MEETNEPPKRTQHPETKFISWGYKTAIVLSLLGMLLSAAYLFVFLLKSHPELIKQDTMTGFSAERRMVLLSTAVFVAMSFGFLGFALFLIQAKGNVDGSFETGNVKVNFTKMSPGLFVILCATVIIIFSITFRINYSVRPVQNGGGADQDYILTPGKNNDTTKAALPFDTTDNPK